MGKFNSSNRNHKAGRAFVKGSYDPTSHSGSSSVDTSDRNPGNSYVTDTRNFDKSEKATAEKAGTNNQGTDDRTQKFLAAARVSGRYQKNALIDEPGIRGNTPRIEANIKGTNVPTLGDKIGITGSTNYSKKPGDSSGTFKGF
jgi:hypothetical protein